MRLAPFLVVLSILWLGSAHAAPPSVQLEELTWTEVRAAIQAGATTIIIPVGGTEQSGPHMALGKHNVRARVLAGRIARMTGANLTIACPRCGSTNTEKISQFGSTPCKANYRCKDCLEPFDYFKCL